MRRLFGALVGFALFFPGALVLRWLVVEELHLYQEMTLTDALLAIIIILASVLIFGQRRRVLTAEELEDQAERMELASRRLERAQRVRDRLRRDSRSSRRSSRDRTSRRPSSRHRSQRDEDDRLRR